MGVSVPRIYIRVICSGILNRGNRGRNLIPLSTHRANESLHLGDEYVGDASVSQERFRNDATRLFASKLPVFRIGSFDKNRDVHPVPSRYSLLE